MEMLCHELWRLRQKGQLKAMKVGGTGLDLTPSSEVEAVEKPARNPRLLLEMPPSNAEKPATGLVGGLPGIEDHATALISPRTSEPSSPEQAAKRAHRSRGLSHSERRYLLSREREEKSG